MDILVIDCIINITSYLINHDIINFLSTSKYLHLLKDKIHYNNPVAICDIQKLHYYDQFTNIIINNLTYTLPKNITHLTINFIDYGFDYGWRYSNKDIKTYIPSTVTHLLFKEYIRTNIKDCIPDTITHLNLGSRFNGSIKDCIPNSITHLTFGWEFNQDIKGCIPKSVTHLIFGYSFNRYIND